MSNKTHTKVIIVGSSAISFHYLKYRTQNSSWYVFQRHREIKKSTTYFISAKSGTITFTAKITDSRGFTASKNVLIHVLEYTFPKLVAEVFRSNEQGVKDYANGDYITIKPSFSYAEIPGNSITGKKIIIDEVTKSTNFDTGGTYTFGSYGVDSEHVVTIEITDALNKTVKIDIEVGIGTIPFHIPIHKKGMGVGRYCDTEGQLQVGYNLNVFGKTFIKNEEQPTFVLVRTLDVEIQKGDG